MPASIRRACGLAALLILLVSPLAPGQVAKSKADDAKSKLHGAWERADVRKGYRQVKIFADGQFTWVIHLVADGKVAAAGGGTYTYDGTTLTEKYAYASGDIQSFIKKDPPSFKITFEGDGFVQDGAAPNGARIKETYRRAK